MQFKTTKDRPKHRPQIGRPFDADATRDGNGEVVQRKNLPRPALAQVIEKKTWENDQLRRELGRERERHRASHQAGIVVAAEVGHVTQSLEESLEHFLRLGKEVEEDLASASDQ